jgi:hypothetical protein
MLYIFFFENNDFWALETAFCSHWQNRGGEKFGLEATYLPSDGLLCAEKTFTFLLPTFHVTTITANHAALLC